MFKNSYSNLSKQILNDNLNQTSTKFRNNSNSNPNPSNLTLAPSLKDITPNNNNYNKKYSVGKLSCLNNKLKTDQDPDMIKVFNT